MPSFEAGLHRQGYQRVCFQLGTKKTPALHSLRQACVCTQIESEDLLFTLETVVEKFGEEIAPYAVGLCQHLAAAFWRIQVGSICHSMVEPHLQLALALCKNRWAADSGTLCLRACQIVAAALWQIPATTDSGGHLHLPCMCMCAVLQCRPAVLSQGCKASFLEQTAASHMCSAMHVYLATHAAQDHHQVRHAEPSLWEQCCHLDMSGLTTLLLAMAFLHLPQSTACLLAGLGRSRQRHPVKVARVPLPLISMHAALQG